MTDSHPRKSILLSTILPTLLVALGVGGLYAMIRGRNTANRDRPHELAPLVQTVSVLAHQGGIDLPVDGVVAPYREIELAAEVPGRILKKNPDCRAGRFVAKGSLLLEIDPRDYQLDLQRLNEQLQQADASLAECDVESANVAKLIVLAQEEHELQKKELTRMQKLVVTAVSESELDKVKKGEWNSRNNLLTLQNQVHLIASRRRGLESARALVRTQIQKAELDLDRTKVLSPADGIVVRDVVEQDSFVQKGTLLVVVEDTTKVEVRCNLKMEDLVWLWRQSSSSHSPTPPLSHSQRTSEGEQGRARDGEAVTAGWGPHYELPRAPVTVTFQMHGSPTRFLWQGTLTRFDGSGIDERTRTVPCRVVVDDPRSVTVDGSSDAAGPRALVRGMYVTVAIHANPQSTFLRIPESAIQPGKNVLRVRGDKLDIVGPLQLVRLAEEAGRGISNKYWIAHAQDTDLTVADKVVISPLPTAYAGMSVREQAAP